MSKRTENMQLYDAIFCDENIISMMHAWDTYFHGRNYLGETRSFSRWEFLHKRVKWLQNFGLQVNPRTGERDSSVFLSVMVFLLLWKDKPIRIKDSYRNANSGHFVIALEHTTMEIGSFCIEDESSGLGRFVSPRMNDNMSIEDKLRQLLLWIREWKKLYEILERMETAEKSQIFCFQEMVPLPVHPELVECLTGLAAQFNFSTVVKDLTIYLEFSFTHNPEPKQDTDTAIDSSLVKGLWEKFCPSSQPFDCD